MDTGILKIVNIFLMCHSPGKPLGRELKVSKRHAEVCCQSDVKMK